MADFGIPIPGAAGGVMLLQYTVFNSVHPEKQSPPIDVTVPGNVMVLKLEQSWNAPFPIEVTLGPISTSARLEHP